ncbi:MAG TPA: hypothetical protein VH331_17945 [Allosphingosinicella sp.]|jgi:hypothetical protein|nr:hypothetical protein [Allosphingosinicella sp.]
MSFREKSAWISLVTTLAVWGTYLALLLQALASGHPDGPRLLGLFSTCVFLVVVAQVVLSVLIAVSAPKEARTPADEREKLIGLKASRIAFFALSGLALLTAFCTPFIAAAGPVLFPRDPLGGTAIAVGSAIFFAVVIAELVRSVGQIVYYRRPV